jgi:hypothetical protein
LAEGTAVMKLLIPKYPAKQFSTYRHVSTSTRSE